MTSGFYLAFWMQNVDKSRYLWEHNKYFPRCAWGGEKKLLDLIFIPILNILPVFQKGTVHFDSCWEYAIQYVWNKEFLQTDKLSHYSWNAGCNEISIWKLFFTDWRSGYKTRNVISHLPNNLLYFSVLWDHTKEYLIITRNQKRPGLPIALETWTLNLWFSQASTSQM